MCVTKNNLKNDKTTIVEILLPTHIDIVLNFIGRVLLG